MKFTNLSRYVPLEKTYIQHAFQLKLILFSSDIKLIKISTYVGTHYGVMSLWLSLPVTSIFVGAVNARLESGQWISKYSSV
jgi:hypothetical protein